MTPDQAAMVEFLHAEYASSLRTSQSIQNRVAAEGLPSLNIAPGAETASRFGGVHAAETRIRFLDETVIPYLGTAGPTGRIADIQLRLLVDEHRGKHGYDEAWRP